MSLNPSNGIAQRMNPGSRVFQNLARRVSDENKAAVFLEVDAACKTELEEAGITVAGLEPFRRGTGDNFREVPTKYIGELCQWGFHRSWYYWVADGPGIPPIAAEEFHNIWGKACRVEGHCGCPSPAEYRKGFAIGLYHIDTQEGLNAFAKLLKSIEIGHICDDNRGHNAQDCPYSRSSQ